MNWEHVKRIYGAASELGPEERAAYLAEACGDDRALHEQVAALLAADAEADSAAFLVDPVGSGGGVEATSRRLGRYELVEKIGEGGFGEVYRAAQHEPLRRDVALKLIKPGMDSRPVIARFEAERQALALMDHPGIARVYDGGLSERGRPYFVMELVAGLPITEYCERHGLSRAARLRLFVRVCQAVQHAHQKGIVHRDLKPGNVLVASGDAEPAIKVIDFGVAKALFGPLSDVTLTEQSHFIGTPAYMSPEQADPGTVDVDTRADVYSLGVLLYELLLGAPPFPAERLRSLGLSEALRVIREESPARPSQTRSGLRGDLDWITLRALEKDRGRRYQTVAALADDVQRYLRDEPVSAGPPSAWYRFSKFARRNRMLLASLATILVVLTAGATAATIGFVQARAQRDRALRAEAHALDQADRATLAEQAAVAEQQAAEAARDDSERARAGAEAVTQFLVEALTSVDPYDLGRDVTMRAVLDNASAMLATRLEGQPRVRARLHTTIGRAYLALGKPGEADEHITTGLALYGEHAGVEDAATTRAREIMAAVREMQGQYAEAEPLRLRAYEWFASHRGEEDYETLDAYARLAGNYARQSRLHDAQRIYEQILPVIERDFGPEGELTLRVRNDMAINLEDLGRYDDAERIYLEVLDIRDRTLGPRHPHTLTTRHSLASLYEIIDRLDQAEQMFLETIATVAEVEGPDHPHVLNSKVNLSAVYDKQNRYDESQALLREVLAAQVQLLGADSLDVLTTRNNLANSLNLSGRFEEALPIQEVVAGQMTDRVGPDGMRSLIARGNLARIYNKLERFDEAERILVDVRGRMQRLHPEHGYTAAVTRHLGVTRMGQERFDEAEALLTEARDGMARAMGPDHMLTGQVEATLDTLAERRAAAAERDRP